jgi:DNA topoisomerase-1
MDVEELVHVHGGEAGLRRERRGDRFAYRDADGERVTDPETLTRIAALKIPPAWTDVWIAAAPNAHLQATGLDAKGRRQYLYHPVWRVRRDGRARPRREWLPPTCGTPSPSRGPVPSSAARC